MNESVMYPIRVFNWNVVKYYEESIRSYLTNPETQTFLDYALSFYTHEKLNDYLHNNYTPSISDDFEHALIQCNIGYLIKSKLSGLSYDLQPVSKTTHDTPIYSLATLFNPNINYTPILVHNFSSLITNFVNIYNTFHFFFEQFKDERVPPYIRLERFMNCLKLNEDKYPLMISCLRQTLIEIKLEYILNNSNN